MEQTKEYSEKISLNVWKKVFNLVFKKKSNIIVIFIYMILLAGLDIFTPLVSSKALEVFFGDNPRFDLTWVFIGIYVLIACAYAIVIHMFIKKAGQIEAQISCDLRKETFEHLQTLSLSYYDKNAAGWIMARLTSDARKLADIISWGLVDMVWGIATMIGILIMLYITFVPLALIITILTPIIFMICLYYRKKILVAYRQVRSVNSKITGAFNEGILGSKTTKTLVLEESKNNEFVYMCNDMKSSSLKAIVRSAFLWPTVLVLAYFGVGLTLGFGGAFVLGKFGGLVITIPVLYLFINYTTLFFDPILQVSRTIADLQQAQAAAERVIGLIETKSDIVDSQDIIIKYGDILNPKRENWESIKGDIEFCNVTFKYNQNDVILDNFSLNVPVGTSVALVGSTGSGKTTIVNLLCRFYEPTSGFIKIDGVDYRERSVNWLHENLGYVLQTPHLFNGTIKDNIRYGKLDATDEQIVEAAKIVCADDFINSFERGYDTEVGEGGSKLSLGQRQLISFARAILKNPQLLVLDEATSSIDTQTEVLIQKAMGIMTKGRTSFIVAHRLSTIINSDLILVIKEGKILEKGNHQELLKLKGEYYSLYKNQFINEKMDKSIK